MLKYAKILKPISLESLSYYLKAELPTLKQIILNFIKQGRLNSKLVNNKLYLAPNP